MTPQALEAKLHHEIPLSKAMAIRMVSVDPEQSSVFASLGPNMNHKSTAFGGSVHSVAVVACWTLITNFLEDQDVDYVVIQRSQIEYAEPIASDFSSQAKWASSAEREKFEKTLERKKLARAKLRATVLCEGKACAILDAEFVAAIRK